MRPPSRIKKTNARLSHTQKHSARTDKADASHKFRIGDPVVVFALSASGRPFIEGRAQVEARCTRRNHFRVRFCGESVSRTRFIHPDWQAEPERSLALLIEFWESSAEPSPFEDFFPDDNV
jgi:hypothetical protein